jgi:beta-glucanase (GH16 family)
LAGGVFAPPAFSVNRNKMKSHPETQCGKQFAAVAMLAACALLTAYSVSTASAQSPDTNAITPRAPVSGYNLVWNDEFNGTALDVSKWGFRTDSKHLSTQKSENVSVKDGLLRLTLKKETAGSKNYTGAGIVSRPAFKYGYYESRAKMPPGAGWHTSFWMMKHDGSGTTDFQAAEQGIVVGQNESIDSASYAVKLDKYQEPAACYGFLRIPTPNLSAEFHVFSCEFTPEFAKFFLDGILVQTVDATKFAHSDQNVWVSSIASHMGNTPKVDDAALPQESHFDYVRVFTKNNGTTPTKQN